MSKKKFQIKKLLHFIVSFYRPSSLFHESFPTITRKTEKRNVFANNILTDIKLSKSKLSLIIHPD